MPKISSRKRQKLSKDATELSLGDKAAELMDDSKKDAEEKRLENLLFGMNHVADEDLVVLDEKDEESYEGAGTALENLLDTDLYFVDDSAPPAPVSISTHLASEDSEEDSETVAGPSQLQKIIPASAKTTTRKAAWSDPSDEPIQVPIDSGRVRKLRDAPGETVLSGREYESRLRRQYETIHPQPEWAKKARKQKRRRGSDSDVTEEDEEEDILTSTAGILAKKDRKVIGQGTIAIERLRDANQVSQSTDGGAIRTLSFHPSDKISVLSVASADRRIRLFNVDGHTNPLLQTIHIPSLLISDAFFHPSGEQLIISGNRPFYHTYDLNSGVTHQSTRGLWGTTFSSSNHGDPIQTLSFSQTGSVLAVAGRSGYVHLVDWKAGGASGQVVRSFKTGSGANVHSLRWTGDDRLMGLSNDAEVYLWDVGSKKCIKRWRDEGGYRGTGRVMDTSRRAGGWLGIGSTSGFVNVYGSDSFTDADEKPKLMKSVANLTTPISTVKFNHDAQLMAIASGDKKDAMRLIHLPSLTSFSNWPNSGTPLGRVSDVEFSSGGGFMAIGNTRGKVLLYHLLDY